MEKVFIILCDTLRAKSLPHYGNERNTIPKLSHLIEKDFVVYNRAYAPAPWTIPSHLSLFTGLYPTEVMESKTSYHLNENFITLSDLFKDSGFKTVALSTNGLISRKFGFDKGFNEFFQMWLPDPEEEDMLLDLDADNDFERALKLFRMIIAKNNKRNLFKSIKQKMYKRFRNNIFKDATISTDETMKLLKKNIAENRNQKTFYFINLMQTHEKHNPPASTRNIFVKNNNKYENYYRKKTYQDHYVIEPFSDGLLNYLKLLYEEEILYLDLVIADFIQSLKANNLYDESTIVITSDHGQQFGEHGHFTRTFSIYEPVIKIPFFIKWPGRLENISKNKDELVMLQDLYSTFLNLLNHWKPCPDSSFDLHSSNKRLWIISQLPDMSHDIKGCVKKRQSFSIKEVGLEEDSLTAYVFEDGTKIIENGSKITCYNLNNDIDEIKPFPISNEDRDKAKRIRDALI